MMQHVPGTRALALIAGLLFAGTGSALAQDTTSGGAATMDTTAPTGAIDTAGTDSAAARDTTDTSATTPPGYSGMERDTSMAADSVGTPLPDSASSAAPRGTGDTTLPGDTESPQPSSAAPRIESTEDSGGTADSTQ